MLQLRTLWQDFGQLCLCSCEQLGGQQLTSLTAGRVHSSAWYSPCSRGLNSAKSLGRNPKPDDVLLHPLVVDPRSSRAYSNLTSGLCTCYVFAMNPAKVMLTWPLPAPKQFSKQFQGGPQVELRLTGIRLERLQDTCAWAKTWNPVEQ